MIEVSGITKRYGHTLAVNALSFEVKPGQITGFLGPNGSGKSTTMRMIMGLDHPDAGQARINGLPMKGLGWPLREVGALLDAKSIHQGRSAFNHLWALAQTNDIPRSRVHEVLDVVGLSSVANKRAGTFSLGMGQRLGIAGALLGDPSVLLFDEPINGLDPEGVRWVRNLLKGLGKEGRTVFVSSHLMSEMALTADHLVVIGRGRLIAEMAVDEFIAQSAEQVVRVRTPQPDEFAEAMHSNGATIVQEEDGTLSVAGLNAQEIGDIALGQHVALHELTPQLASLEEAFMEITKDSVDYRSEGGFAADSTRKSSDDHQILTGK